MSFERRQPAEFIVIDDPVYGRYAQSWYCTLCGKELGADLADPSGEVPGCPDCGTDEHIAFCEWGDVVDEDTGLPVNPGPLAHLAMGDKLVHARVDSRTRVGMSIIDARGNKHRPAGSPDAGRFAGRVNPQPPGHLEHPTSEAPRYCSKHSGSWGEDETCTNCTDVYGAPIAYPFPTLRDGRLPHEIDVNLHWVANPEGPSVVNPNGGVWHVTAYGRPLEEPEGVRSLTPMSFLDLQVGVVPSELAAEGGGWWRLDSSPTWLRERTVPSLREPSAADREMSAGIAAAERRDRERLEATGELPVRAAND